MRKFVEENIPLLAIWILRHAQRVEVRPYDHVT